MYDPRAGRFLSVDPLMKNYPWYTPYQFAGDKPIVALDLDGQEESFYNFVFPPLHPKTPAAIMSTEFQKSGAVFRDSKTGRFLNGAFTTTTGIIGTVASAVYIGGSEGAGAALGGAVAMQFSLAQTAIGIAQIVNVFQGPRDKALDAASSLPGLIAYESGSKYSPYIDFLGGLVPSFTLSGEREAFASLGNFTRQGFGLVESVKSYINAPSIRSALEMIDQLKSFTEVSIESFKLHSEISGEIDLAQKLDYTLSYTVKKGDNLSKISRIFGTSVDELAKQNGIKDPNHIKEGQAIKFSNTVYGKENLSTDPDTGGAAK
jgi:LysM domain